MINALKGTKDIFGKDVRRLQYLENTIREVCENFGITEIRTPIFELTKLFHRGVGDTTDIVQKEMYSFVDKGENNITLKPESTAPVVRAYLEHNMDSGISPTKLYYISPAFRYERPEAGRLRQFHQFGVEVFGSSSPLADAEVIAVADTLLKKLDITGVTLHINSLGGPQCRQAYNQKLIEFLNTKKDKLCPLCNERRVKNPLRVLDCKNATCQSLFTDAPTTLDALDGECRTHFDTLIQLLDEMNISYTINTKIVRGLDYYTRTVFEFISDDIGTICGGGRYDKLVEQIGTKSIPAVGFGTGIERVLMALEDAKISALEGNIRDIFIGFRGDVARNYAFNIVHALRQKGIKADTDLLARSVKAQMKYANKIGAKYSTIIGESELESGKFIIKNMETGEEKEVIDILIELPINF